MSVTVSLARDARIHHELYPETELYVILRGRITNIYRRSNKVLFATLRDISETIQVLVDKNLVGDEIWVSFESLELGVGVELHGSVGASKSGKLSVFPARPPIVLRQLSLRDLLTDEYSGVGTQMLLSRLENRCRRFLEGYGYIELAPRYLSSYWPDGGLQALNVLFPGQSRVPFYLAVSPVPQLLRALLAVGQSNFFTISRTFATNFVPTQNGAESVIAGAILLESSIDESGAVALALVKDLLHHYETAMDPAFRSEWEIPHTSSTSGSLNHTPTHEGLHIHFAKGLRALFGPGGFPVTETFQIQWRNELVLSEGSSMSLGQDILATTLTLYIERFLPLLRAQDNRRIRDLVRPGNSEEASDDNLTANEAN